MITALAAGQESSDSSSSSSSSSTSSSPQDEILIVPKPPLSPLKPSLSRGSVAQSLLPSISLSSLPFSSSSLPSTHHNQHQNPLTREQNLIDSIFPEKRFDCKTTVVLNDTRGFIKTPDYSTSLPVTCRWIISGTGGRRANDSQIVITFERLHLVNSLPCSNVSSSTSTSGHLPPTSGQRDCCRNFLHISGRNVDETFCTTAKNFELSADGQNVTIDFHSEYGTSANNFYLSYKVFPRESPKCRCRCANGECLAHEHQICNKRTECSDGSDEAFCLGHKQKRSKLIFEMCRASNGPGGGKKLLPNFGHVALPMAGMMGVDESTCTGDRFHCHFSRQCVPRLAVCDGEIDCFDHSDETNCTQAQCAGIVCDQSRCVSNDR